MSGIVFEEGASIVVRSMVTKSTEPWIIYFGIPVKGLQKRRRELMELLQKYTREQAT